MEKRWLVPENCPIKRVVESLDGTLRRDYSCNICLVNCPLRKPNPSYTIQLKANNWIIRFAKEFSNHISSIKSGALRESPIFPLTKDIKNVKLSGIYSKIKNHMRHYFDFEWNKEAYDFLVSIVLENYQKTPNIRIVR